MRWATSRACQCSSGLKYVCTNKALTTRNAKQSAKTLFVEENIKDFESFGFWVVGWLGVGMVGFLCLCLIVSNSHLYKYYSPYHLSLKKFARHKNKKNEKSILFNRHICTLFFIQIQQNPTSTRTMYLIKMWQIQIKFIALCKNIKNIKKIQYMGIIELNLYSSPEY